MNDSKSLPRTTTAVPDRSGIDGVRSSLAFWGCLLGAIAIYGLVALSPKVVRWSSRAEEFAKNQQQLVLLRHEIEDAEQLARDWRRRLSRSEAADETLPIGTGAREILVDEQLRYHAVSRPSPREIPSRSHSVGQVLSVMQALAHSFPLRIGGLATSAALLLVAFSCFAGRSSIRRTVNRESHQVPPRHSLFNRYRLPPSLERSVPTTE